MLNALGQPTLWLPHRSMLSDTNQRLTQHHMACKHTQLLQAAQPSQTAWAGCQCCRAATDHVINQSPSNTQHHPAFPLVCGGHAPAATRACCWGTAPPAPHEDLHHAPSVRRPRPSWYLGKLLTPSCASLSTRDPAQMLPRVRTIKRMGSASVAASIRCRQTAGNTRLVTRRLVRDLQGQGCTHA